MKANTPGSCITFFFEGVLGLGNLQADKVHSLQKALAILGCFKDFCEDTLKSLGIFRSNYKQVAGCDCANIFISEALY